MIRPSQLQIAEHCGLAPRLAEQFPEASAAADRGTEIHRQIAARKPESAEAKAALDFLAGLPDAMIEHEVRLRLEDPDSGELITAGTADAIIRGSEGLLVVDWKTGNPDYVEAPEDNLQLWAYALAAMSHETDRIGVALAFLDGSRLDLRRSDMLPCEMTWPLFERIRKAATRPPVATPGDHCGRCWQRWHCDAYRDRARHALTIVNEPRDLALTDDTAAELLRRAELVEEAAKMAKELVKSHVRNGGRIESNGKVYVPQTVAGRRTADVAALERDGLAQYVKQGESYERWSWRRA
jgi:hypothetical protein